MFFAGYPITFVFEGTFLITPLPPPICTLSPIFKWPDIPAWPPIKTLLPIDELPANPTCAVIMQFFPIFTLCAMWTWLSIKVPSPIIVLESEPLSIVLLDPISTSLPIITDPMWG